MRTTKEKVAAPADPDEGTTVTLQLSEREDQLLQEGAAMLTEEAGEELRSEPMKAGLRQFVALFLLQASCRYEIALAHRAKVRPAEKPAATQGERAMRKVKHVYGDNGICGVEHEAGHVCGLLRQRKPRGTASPAVQTAESRTGDLLNHTTHGKNGQPPLPSQPDTTEREGRPTS